MSDTKPLKTRKREAIVVAARALFVEAGYQQSSMDAIAARAEVSKRTLYNHFPSKEALFHEIAEQLWQAQIRAKRLRYEREQALAPQLAHMAEQYLAILQSNANLQLSRVLLAELLHAPDLAQQVMARMAEGDSELVKWIQQAIDDGRLRVHEPQFSATQFWSLLKAFGLWPQLLANAPQVAGEQQRRVIDSAVGMYLAYYQSECETQ